MLDIGISMEHLILAAADKGLGTCWIGAFDEAIAKSALGVPDDMRVVALTPLGQPDEEPTPGTRPSDAVRHVGCESVQGHIPPFAVDFTKVRDVPAQSPCPAIVGQGVGDQRVRPTAHGAQPAACQLLDVARRAKQPAKAQRGCQDLGEATNA